MTMYHHDNRNYEQASSEARDYLRTSLQKNAARAAHGLQRLHDRTIVDELMPLSGVDYDNIAPGGGLLVNANGITSQAFGQLCTKVGIPVTYARKLIASENMHLRNLAVESFETLSVTSSDVAMLRSVDGVIHGVVSDSYKRMDSKLIVGSFAESISSQKLMPVQCDLSPTSVYVKALMPRLYGEQFGEALVFGVELSTSDFGFKPAKVQAFCERVWCTNRATMSIKLGHGFKRQHRGMRITEDTFALSAETQEAQALAMGCEFRDAVKGLLSDTSIEAYVGAIGRCFAEGQKGGKFEAEREIEKLLEKSRMTQKVATFVTEVYASTDRDVVPQLDGRWKLAQAIAYASQHADLDIDTRMDLEYLAGEVVDSAPANALPADAN